MSSILSNIWGGQLRCQIGYRSESEVGLSVVEKLYNTIEALNNVLGPENYAVVGGVARLPYTNDPKLPLGTDLDVVIRNGIDSSIFNQIPRDYIFLPVGASLSRYLHFDSDGVCLSYNGINHPIDPSVFETYNVVFNGIHFATFRPRTLLHLYGLRGRMRKKDFRNALTMGRSIKSNPEIDLPEIYYVPFHMFNNELKALPMTIEKAMAMGSYYYSLFGLDCLPFMRDESLRLLFWNMLSKIQEH